MQALALEEVDDAEHSLGKCEHRSKDRGCTSHELNFDTPMKPEVSSRVVDPSCKRFGPSAI